jgi:hypothetical protein
LSQKTIRKTPLIEASFYVDGKNKIEENQDEENGLSKCERDTRLFTTS